MTQHDQDYYAKRERQERDHAARADDASARRIHLEMAERYQAKLNGTAQGRVATAR